MMTGSVADFLRKIKPPSRDLATALIIILVGCAGFGLGRLSPVSITGEGARALPLPQPGAVQLSGSVPATVETASSGQYVASKNGAAYHFPWCGGAKQISEKNKSWFTSKEEAEANGYRPAANCKGL